MSYGPYRPTFTAGTRVKVVRENNKYAENLLGLIGTVRTDCSGSVAVIFDTVKNTRSAYDCFYFKPVELVEVDEFNNEIKEENKMEKITGYLNCVKVTFYGNDRPSSMPYANFDPELAVGDFCAVRYGSDKIDVAKVSEILDNVDGDIHNEVVARVDVTDYNTRVQSRAKAAELKAKMEARAKQLQDIALYQMLAKDDPEMAALLADYQSVSKM